MRGGEGEFGEWGQIGEAAHEDGAGAGNGAGERSGGLGFEAESIAFEGGEGLGARQARGGEDLAFGEEDGDGEGGGAER